MPMTCSNKLTIRGDTISLDEIRYAINYPVEYWEEYRRQEIRKRLDEKWGTSLLLRLKDYYENMYSRKANSLFGLLAALDCPPSVAFSENENGPQLREEWCILFWGTKGETYDYSVNSLDNRMEITFETVWSAPISWVKRVSGRFCDCHFTIEYEDESGEVGTYELERGEVLSSWHTQRTDDEEELDVIIARVLRET